MAKKIVIIVNDEDFEDTYAEITSNLDYDNIKYSISAMDIEVKE